MSLGRMVAALAATLAVATLAAALAAEETVGLAVVMSVLALLAALAIAAVVLAPVVIVRAARGERRWQPGRRLVAVALIAGGLIVLPVYWHFYTEPGLSGPVGRCLGIVPLGELVQTRLAGDEHAAVYYFASCDD